MKNERFIKKVADKANVSYSINTNGSCGYCIDFEYWSALGEDCIIELVVDDLTKKEIIKVMENEYENFDYQQHAVDCYNMGGQNGTPTDLEALLTDAKKQDEKMKEILDIMKELA